MGMNVQQLMTQDPETLQRQAYMREMQQLNPSGSAAGAIGAVLGRGIGNVTQGRGFFQTNDAGLQRVAQAQSIYNEVMRDFDPENPASSLTMLSKRLADAGLAEPAMLAAQEAAKYTAQARQLAATEEGLDLRRQQFQLELDKEERLGRYTEAQIEQMRKDGSKILTGRDAMGATVFYKEDPKTGKLKIIEPEGAPARGPAAASGLPGNLTPDQIRAELARRQKQGK
jgi:hypothetical protein